MTNTELLKKLAVAEAEYNRLLLEAMRRGLGNIAEEQSNSNYPLITEVYREKMGDTRGKSDWKNPILKTAPAKKSTKFTVPVFRLEDFD